MPENRQKYIRDRLSELLNMPETVAPGSDAYAPEDLRKVIRETARSVGIESLVGEYLRHCIGTDRIDAIPIEKLQMVFRYVRCAADMLETGSNVVPLRRISND
jgi:hypothetical protein